MAQEQVRYWFEQAIQRHTRERGPFLDRECGSPTIRSQVLSLLEYDEGDSAAPPPAVRSAMETILSGDRIAAPVARVGAFELGRLLGSGGMGFVYEGRRVDGEVQQRVAIKFAQVSPVASEEFRRSVHRRFARERQMLASLRHPYIAGLIDAGQTEDGIPYAVIEQIDGVPIDAYCDGWLPHHADRIRLFLKLCQAVQFAHGNLVVHSDIKPENVLVTADGNPKLIDFGVATDLADEATDSTVRGFTPAYASPEQCLGLAPTVATDVYGLGAVLYRLLAGAAPRQLGGESLDDAIRRITDEEAARPSSIRPELKGDLENILLKALQREPSRRYGSVPEFAEDLQRYLSRRPVAASPDSMFYRASRFMRRHWIPVGGAAMLGAGMALAVVVSMHERQEAFQRAADTRRLAERLLFEVHDEIGPAVGGTRAREKLGEIAVQYLEGLERNYRPDSQLTWELLNAYARLAQSRGGAAASVGDTKSGWNLAAQALALGAAVENSKPDADRMDKLFEIYNGLAPIFVEARRQQEHRATVDRMLLIAPRLAPVREAQALKQLARYYEEWNMPAQSAEAWARALAVIRTLPDTAAARSERETQLISTLVGCARAQSLAGDFTGSISNLQEAMRLAEIRAASEPGIGRSTRQLYWAHLNLGDALGSPLRFSLGRAFEAAIEYRKARAIAEALVKADRNNEMAKLDLSRAYIREGLAIAASEPGSSLSLLEHSQQVVGQVSAHNLSGLESRFWALAGAVLPLVALGQFDTARTRASEARRLAEELQRDGFVVDRTILLTAEQALLYGTGRRLEALHAAQRHLAELPAETRPTLSENFAAVELLERVRAYAAGVDPGACASASDRLVRIWTDLRASHAASAFARAQAERALALKRNGCESHSEPAPGVGRSQRESVARRRR